MARYQGWTNIETYIVNLYLTNNRAFYEGACGCLSADELRTYVKESAESTKERVGEWWEPDEIVWELADIGFSRVNWKEIYDQLKR